MTARTIARGCAAALPSLSLPLPNVPRARSRPAPVSKRLGPRSILSTPKLKFFFLDIPDTRRLGPRRYSRRSGVLPPRLGLIPPPPPPVHLAGNDEWEINDILDSKRAGRGVKYLVDWKGYGPEERTWEPLSSLDNSAETVLKYHKTNPTKIKPAALVLQRFMERNGVNLKIA